MDTETLKALGIPECDIAQTIAAEKYVKCTIDGERVSKKTVRARLGERRYWNAMNRAAFHWSAMNRAAFHWSAATMGEDGREYGFNCRDYFRE